MPLLSLVREFLSEVSALHQQIKAVEKSTREVDLPGKTAKDELKASDQELKPPQTAEAEAYKKFSAEYEKLDLEDVLLVPGLGPADLAHFASCEGRQSANLGRSLDRLSEAEREFLLALVKNAIYQVVLTHSFKLFLIV